MKHGRKPGDVAAVRGGAGKEYMHAASPLFMQGVQEPDASYVLRLLALAYGWPAIFSGMAFENERVTPSRLVSGERMCKWITSDLVRAPITAPALVAAVDDATAFVLAYPVPHDAVVAMRFLRVLVHKNMYNFPRAEAPHARKPLHYLAYKHLYQYPQPAQVRKSEAAVDLMVADLEGGPRALYDLKAGLWGHTDYVWNRLRSRPDVETLFRAIQALSVTDPTAPGIGPPLPGAIDRLRAIVVATPALNQAALARPHPIDMRTAARRAIGLLYMIGSADNAKYSPPPAVSGAPLDILNAYANAAGLPRFEGPPPPMRTPIPWNNAPLKPAPRKRGPAPGTVQRKRKTADDEAPAGKARAAASADDDEDYDDPAAYGGVDFDTNEAPLPAGTMVPQDAAEFAHLFSQLPQTTRFSSARAPTPPAEYVPPAPSAPSPGAELSVADFDDLDFLEFEEIDFDDPQSRALLLATDATPLVPPPRAPFAPPREPTPADGYALATALLTSGHPIGALLADSMALTFMSQFFIPLDDRAVLGEVYALLFTPDAAVQAARRFLRHIGVAPDRVDTVYAAWGAAAATETAPRGIVTVGTLRILAAAYATSPSMLPELVADILAFRRGILSVGFRLVWPEAFPTQDDADAREAWRCRLAARLAPPPPPPPSARPTLPPPLAKPPQPSRRPPTLKADTLAQSAYATLRNYLATQGPGAQRVGCALTAAMALLHLTKDGGLSAEPSIGRLLDVPVAATKRV